MGGSGVGGAMQGAAVGSAADSTKKIRRSIFQIPFIRDHIFMNVSVLLFRVVGLSNYFLDIY